MEGWTDRRAFRFYIANPEGRYDLFLSFQRHVSKNRIQQAMQTCEASGPSCRCDDDGWPLLSSIIGAAAAGLNIVGSSTSKEIHPSYGRQQHGRRQQRRRRRRFARQRPAEGVPGGAGIAGELSGKFRRRSVVRSIASYCIVCCGCNTSIRSSSSSELSLAAGIHMVCARAHNTMQGRAWTSCLVGPINFSSAGLQMEERRPSR